MPLAQGCLLARERAGLEPSAVRFPSALFEGCPAQTTLLWAGAGENVQLGWGPFRNSGKAPALGVPRWPRLSPCHRQGHSVCSSPWSGRMVHPRGAPAALGQSHGGGASPTTSIIGRREAELPAAARRLFTPVFLWGGHPVPQEPAVQSRKTARHPRRPFYDTRKGSTRRAAARGPGHRLIHFPHFSDGDPGAQRWGETCPGPLSTTRQTWDTALGL